MHLGYWKLLLLSLLSTFGLSLGDSCPANFQCSDQAMNKCMENEFSLQGWSHCCAYESAAGCRSWEALNSKCVCESVGCNNAGELQRGRQGVEVLCLPTPQACSQPCPKPSMLRERHTCLCMQLSHSFSERNITEVSSKRLWGDPGGPYLLISDDRQQL